MEQQRQFLQWLFRTLAWAFGVTGALFFLFPDGTVDILNRAGSLFGLPDAPHLTHRFWLGLGTAYMAVVTVLAKQISEDPLDRRLLMQPLIVGKAVSSATCLLFFIFDRSYFIYLANFLVDGGLVVLVWWAWQWSDPSRPQSANPSAPTNGTGLGNGPDGIMRAIADVFLPPGEPFDICAEDVRLAERVAQHIGERGPAARIALSLLLRFLNRTPLLTGRIRPLTGLDVDERALVLERLEASRWVVLRQPVVGIRLMLGLHAYRDPATRNAIGHDAEHLQKKLEQARKRRADGKKGPYPAVVSPDALR